MEEIFASKKKTILSHVHFSIITYKFFKTDQQNYLSSSNQDSNHTCSKCNSRKQKLDKTTNFAIVASDYTNHQKFRGARKFVTPKILKIRNFFTL